jgi:glucose/arabinose dehydrogenase
MTHAKWSKNRFRRGLSVAALAGVAGAFLGAGMIPSSALAADKPKSEKKEKPKKDAPYDRMDYGPYLSASFISHPAAKYDNGPGTFSSDSTARGFAIKLADGFESGLIFDSDLMRTSCAWTEGSLRFRGLIGDGEHGWDPGPTLPPLFETPHLPGWADANGSFADPRNGEDLKPLPPAGPLPHDYARYKGLYRHGEQIVLSYTVNGADVLESPSLETKGDAKAVVRSFTVGKSAGPLEVMVAEGKPDPAVPKEPTKELKIDSDTTATMGDLHIAVVGAPAGSKLEKVEDTAVALKLPALAGATNFEILVAGGGEKDKTDFDEIVKDGKPADLSALTHGGPSLWKETVETKGELAKETDQPYVIDRLTIPYDNPYHSWMRIGGFDFFADGKRAALSTWSGDVWIVSGIDQGLDHLTWKRFATGLHQPLGLKIVDDTIYTVGHDQITKLIDLDGDGEADFYQDFNSDWQLTSAFHAFCFDLQTDPSGNFFFNFGSPVHAGGGGFQKISADHGCILKVSKDGKYMEHFATGLRAPNGMCVGPHGEVTTGDNEGSWVPSSPLHWVKQGQFLGVVTSAHHPMKSTDQKPDPSETPKPLFWLSHNGGVDNSSGGQVWVTSDKWGPFKDDLLFMSYGQSRLFKVMYEEVNGQMQGGAVAFPLKFTSSAMRARVNPADGQVYVSGLKGWQTNAGKDGGFDRVRYTGQPVRMPKELHTTPTGMAITFTCPLDKATAEDPDNYDVQVWNYIWRSDYGSPEVSTNATATGKEKKDKPAHDTLDVKSAKLSADGKTVVLTIEGIKPVMQMKIEYKHVKAADGTDLHDTIENTIHNLPAPTANR